MRDRLIHEQSHALHNCDDEYLAFRPTQAQVVQDAQQRSMRCTDMDSRNLRRTVPLEVNRHTEHAHTLTRSHAHTHTRGRSAVPIQLGPCLVQYSYITISTDSIAQTITLPRASTRIHAHPRASTRTYAQLPGSLSHTPRCAPGHDTRVLRRGILACPAPPLSPGRTALVLWDVLERLIDQLGCITTSRLLPLRAARPRKKVERDVLADSGTGRKSRRVWWVWWVW
jgi:hypothetical protein